MATLMLLGAGASFGSEPSGAVPTPPLGANLFDALEELGGAASRVPDDIKAEFKKDFETGMSLYNLKHSVKLQEFHRELSYYLSGFTPSASSAYLNLLNNFAKKNIVFSSLNYDMMFEEAADEVGLQVHYHSSREVGFVRLLKPHGSLNFWPVIPAGSLRGCTFQGVSVAISSDVAPLTRSAARERCLEDDSLSPAISMYAKGKQVSVCPDFVSYQQQMFAQVCRRASRIISLGVRVVAEDGHIWGPISESAAELIYFGNDADRLELEAWTSSVKRKNVTFVNGYFNDCLTFLARTL